jgi:hypothetical protein
MNRKIKLLPTAFSEYTVEADDSQLEQLGY